MEDYFYFVGSLYYSYQIFMVIVDGLNPGRKMVESLSGDRNSQIFGFVTDLLDTLVKEPKDE